MDSLLSEELQPSQIGRRLLGRWPLIFAMAVLGGLIGLAANRVFPASYQASAGLGIGPDPNLAAPFSNNVQYEADLRTQDLFLSDATLEDARRALPPNLAGASVAEFRSHLRLDHIEGAWYLRATAGSPGDAVARADAWASAAAAQFKAAQAHAIKAGEFQALLFSVACRPEVVIGQNKANLWSCDEMNLNIDPDQVSAELLAEARLSQGILPGLAINAIQQAFPPAQPMVQARALFVLGGTLAGLVVGLLWAWSGLPWGFAWLRKRD